MNKYNSAWKYILGERGPIGHPGLVGPKGEPGVAGSEGPTVSIISTNKVKYRYLLQIYSTNIHLLYMYIY